MAVQGEGADSLQSEQLRELEVRGLRHDFDVRNVQMSAIGVTADMIEKAPSIFGETDVLKTLQRMPGVQQGSDGSANIVVRGGDYDQNLIMLDGTVIYNTEHLNGYVSAINPDMVGDVVLYKGAFPACYGSRLSSVIDMQLGSGDMWRYHGGLTVGMLGARIHGEGPIIPGKLSLSAGARVSYLDAYYVPMMARGNKEESEASRDMMRFKDMSYYDVTAKLRYLLSERDEFTLMFYKSHDTNTPPATKGGMGYSSLENTDEGMRFKDSKGTNLAKEADVWGNIVGNAVWNHRFNSKWNMHAVGSFSQYLSKIVNSRVDEEEISWSEAVQSTIIHSPDGIHQEVTTYWRKGNNLWKRNVAEETNRVYQSKINSLSGNADFTWKSSRMNVLNIGANIEYQNFKPVVKTRYSKDVEYSGVVMPMPPNEHVSTDTINDNGSDIASLSAYAEDEITLGKHIRIRGGLRYSLFVMKGKAYNSLEPRVSFRCLLPGERVALKASYTRMSQVAHLRRSGNITDPSDMWVSSNKNIAPMLCNQYAAGLTYNISDAFDMTLEGYYKNLDNMLEYREGMLAGPSMIDWEKCVAAGRGWSYGLELLVQKQLGRTTGVVSYTWSKSLRQFDCKGNIIYEGKPFYSPNDCRNNFNILISHSFNEHWTISGSWTFMTGRRGNVPTVAYFLSSLHDYADYRPDALPWYDDVLLPDVYNFDFTPDKYGVVRIVAPAERNGYLMPAIHHLDVSVDFKVRHRSSESKFNFSIYNLYNRMNVSRIFMTTDRYGRMTLKGVCNFPITPSFSYTISF